MYATGITYDYRGVTLTKKVYKMFLAWGQARMGGYKASWSKEMCRTCTMTLDWFRASRTEPSFLECRLRSFAEHDPTIEDVRTKWDSETKAGREALADSREGYVWVHKNVSCFRPSYVNHPEYFVRDIMHDLLEGTAEKELFCFLKWLKKYCSANKVDVKFSESYEWLIVLTQARHIAKQGYDF
eukprot:Rmarinus@m.19440